MYCLTSETIAFQEIGLSYDTQSPAGIGNLFSTCWSERANFLNSSTFFLKSVIFYCIRERST